MLQDPLQSNPLQSIVLIPDQVPEAFQGHQLAHQFRYEHEQRRAFEDHCRWYEQIAAQHQQELEAMRCELNLFRWFCRN